MIFAQLPAPVLVTLLIWGEARGEPIEGQIAVGCVVRNRVVRSGHDWRAVCLAPFQFSCFNESDLEYPKVQRAAVVLMTGELTPALRQVVWITDGILSGAAIDNTHGAQNYLTTELLHRAPPRWALDRQILARYGAHSFLTA